MAHISSKRNGAVKKNSLGVSQTKNNYSTISKGHRIRFFAPLPQKNPLIEPKIHYMSLLAVPLTSSAFLQGTTFTTDEKI